MLTERELIKAIQDLENAEPTYERCKKLVTFYTLYDFMYGQPKNETEEERVVKAYGESEFIRVIDGKDTQKVWAVIDELMTTLEVINPRLYQGVMVKLAE